LDAFECRQKGEPCQGNDELVLAAAQGGFDSEAIELGFHFHESGFRQAPYRHFCTSALTDVVPLVRGTRRVLDGGAHILSEAHFPAGWAERSHPGEMVAKQRQSKPPLQPGPKSNPQ
jgi:hypothetical protein